MITSKKIARFVLFRLIKKRSFNLLCVLNQYVVEDLTLCSGTFCNLFNEQLEDKPKFVFSPDVIFCG